MNLESLKDHFPAADIEWRIQSCGLRGNGNPWALALAYVTNRAIMERLDAVCGPENWRNQFAPAPGGGVLCGLSIRCGDEWVTKYDGAENTAVEAVKGGLSASMKRAAVQWGIGRYLYHLPETFCIATTERPQNRDGWKQAYDKKSQKTIYWAIPDLPPQFLP